MVVSIHDIDGKQIAEINLHDYADTFKFYSLDKAVFPRRGSTFLNYVVDDYVLITYLGHTSGFSSIQAAKITDEGVVDIWEIKNKGNYNWSIFRSYIYNLNGMNYLILNDISMGHLYENGSIYRVESHQPECELTVFELGSSVKKIKSWPFEVLGRCNEIDDMQIVNGGLIFRVGIFGALPKYRNLDLVTLELSEYDLVTSHIKIVESKISSDRKYEYLGNFVHQGQRKYLWGFNLNSLFENAGEKLIDIVSEDGQILSRFDYQYIYGSSNYSNIRVHSDFTKLSIALGPEFSFPASQMTIQIIERPHSSGYQIGFSDRILFQNTSLLGIIKVGLLEFDGENHIVEARNLPSFSEGEFPLKILAMDTLDEKSVYSVIYEKIDDATIYTKLIVEGPTPENLSSHLALTNPWIRYGLSNVIFVLIFALIFRIRRLPAKKNHIDKLYGEYSE